MFGSEDGRFPVWLGEQTWEDGCVILKGRVSSEGPGWGIGVQGRRWGAIVLRNGVQNQEYA